MKRRIKITILTLIGILFLLGQTMTASAAGTGSVALSVSSQSVNIGDTITVSVQALGPSGETAVAVMNISFDSSIFQFVSCSDSTYGGGGSNVSVATDSATITLKAVAQGTAAISVTGYNGVIYSSNEDMDAMNGSSTSVTVSNAAGEGTAAEGEVKLSDDNSLSSLSLSNGTLSPAFKQSTTKYTASVPYDVTSVTVSAKTSNEKAQIVSVSGNTGLSVGENTISIVVKAENNVTATYTITLTREAEKKEETPEETQEPETEDTETETTDTIAVMVNDGNYYISEAFTEEEIPEGFTETTVTYQGMDFRGLKFEQGELYLLYLIREGESENGSFFIYDNAQNIIYPFIQLSCGENYIILLMLPVDGEIPDGYVETTLNIRDKGMITAYQLKKDDAGDPEESIQEEETEDPYAVGMRKSSGGKGLAAFFGFEPEIVYASEMEDLSLDATETAVPMENTQESGFYLVYAINKDGIQNWYQYDTIEGTYQRFEETGEDVSEEYDALLTAYNDLNNQYTALKSRDRKIMLTLLVLFVISLVLNVILGVKRKFLLPEDDLDFEEDDEEYADDAAEVEIEDDEDDEDEYGEDEYEEDEYEPDEYEEDEYETDEETAADTVEPEESGEASEGTEAVKPEENVENTQEQTSEEPFRENALEEAPTDEAEMEENEVSGEIGEAEAARISGKTEVSEEDEEFEDEYDDSYDEEYENDRESEKATKVKQRKSKGRKKKNRKSEEENTDETLEVIDLNDL